MNPYTVLYELILPFITPQRNLDRYDGTLWVIPLCFCTGEDPVTTQPDDLKTRSCDVVLSQQPSIDIQLLFPVGLQSLLDGKDTRHLVIGNSTINQHINGTRYFDAIAFSEESLLA